MKTIKRPFPSPSDDEAFQVKRIKSGEYGSSVGILERVDDANHFQKMGIIMKSPY